MQTYRKEAGFNGAPTQETLTALLSDLGHLASDEGVSYLALLAYAQAFWLKQANVRQRGRENRPLSARHPIHTPILWPAL